MKKKFCQSCGMPMGDKDEHYGSNSDASKSTDYCSYCYINGQFSYDCSMDEMISVCVPHMLKVHAEMTEQQARSMMQDFFPTLKRWKKAF